MSKKNIPTLGVASCVGGPSKTCAQGPKVLQASKYALQNLNWQPMLEVSTTSQNSLNALKKQSYLISQFTQQQLENKRPFLVLGGDHSIAVGTWAGVINQLAADSSFALIWIDAHMDAHTIETSPSGNLHGMPVSMLLGEVEHELLSCVPAQQYLNGRNLYLFGVRSYEADELVLLSRQKVNVFDTATINRDGGTQVVLKQLIETIARCYDYFAISLDLDAIDPHDAPGVETREETGLSAKNLLSVFNDIEFDDKFIGLEIAEFDPQNDINKKTEKLIFEIIESIFS